MMGAAEDEKLYAYFYETVVVPYVEYKTTRNERKAGTRKDFKSAIAAATAAYHFREHLPDQYKKGHKAIVALCADFALLGDVVNAAKHKLLTKGKPQIASADSIRELIVNTQFQDEQGEYNVASKSIDIALKDGTSRELFDVLTNVVNMWIDFLQAAGISGKATKFPHEDRNRIIGRDEAGRMDLVMTQGLAAQLGFKLQKYNYAKGCPEPVDLTGKQISFSAYDPRSMKIEAGMQVTTAEGKKYAGTVELDVNEKGEFFLLEGKAEQKAFMNKVIKRRGELTLHSDPPDPAGADFLIVKFKRPSGDP